MHIFESQTVRDVIHALPIPIVAETLGLYHFVDFFLGCQSLTVYVWLREHYTHKPVAVASETNDLHNRFGEKAIMKHDGIKGLLPSGID